MKTAVITGASYGIGKSIAEKLLENNYKVYGISRTRSDINNDNFVWLKVDLSSEEQIKSSLEKIIENKLDLLVNNVGTHFEEKFSDFTYESFERMFRLNFLSAVNVTNLLLNKLNRGLVVNISSTSDRFAEKGSGLYCASKAALDIFFETFGLENEQIKMIHILPNYVDTPLQRSMKHDNNFDWSQCVSSEKVAEVVAKVVNNEIKVVTNSKIIILNNKSLDAIEDSEILYSYNVDQDEIGKVK